MIFSISLNPHFLLRTTRTLCITYQYGVRIQVLDVLNNKKKNI